MATGRTHRPATRSRGIPEATVARLPLYLRALTALSERSVPTVSSEELAAAAGVNSAKLRKDFSYLGSYGTRGVGYDVEYLVYQISRELGLTQDWPVVIVGIGNLGARARQLRRLRLPRFPGRGADRRRPRAWPASRSPGCRCGTPTSWRRSSRATSVSIGVIATPAGAAQQVCDRLVAAGVTSHPQLRADRAVGARGRRRAQGRPLHRAADPRLPRAAQGRRGSRASRPAAARLAAGKPARTRRGRTRRDARRRAATTRHRTRTTAGGGAA